MATAATNATEVRDEPTSPRPELTFRGLLPNEALIDMAREQDALLRGVLSAQIGVAQVLIERSHDRAPHHRVRVAAEVGGEPKRGCAEHRDAASALRMAFSSLLRHVAGGNQVRDCAAWAA